jgi:hypothetical protein
MNLPSQATAYPDWAIQKAVAALNTGMKVPDIESLLVARGLDRTTANSFVVRSMLSKPKKNGSRFS